MEFTLKLTGEQIDILGAALGEIPFKVAAPVFTEIQKQVQEQQQQFSAKEG